MNDLKWADVAHHYQDIDVKFDRDKSGYAKASRFYNGEAAICYVADARHGSNYGETLYGWIKDGEYKPILRHLEDMTEEEDAECAKVHCYFVDKEITGLPSVIWALAKRHASFNQYSAYWLISRGFDLFGLIESGEATRNPKP